MLIIFPLVAMMFFIVFINILKHDKKDEKLNILILIGSILFAILVFGFLMALSGP